MPFFLLTIITWAILINLLEFSTPVTINVATFVEASDSSATIPSNSQKVVPNATTTKNASPQSRSTTATSSGLISDADQAKLDRVLNQLKGKSAQESAKVLKELAKRAADPLKKKIEHILEQSEKAREQLKREVREKLDKMASKDARREGERILKIMTDKKLGAKQKTELVIGLIRSAPKKVLDELKAAQLTVPANIVASGFKWNA